MFAELLLEAKQELQVDDHRYSTDPEAPSTIQRSVTGEAARKLGGL